MGGGSLTPFTPRRDSIASMASRSSDGRRNSLAMYDANSCFMVEHFAGHVEYDPSNFVSANRDDLTAAGTELLRKSDNKLLREGAGRLCCPGGQTKKTTVVKSFVAELTAMLQNLGNVRFLRCVGANPHAGTGKAGLCRLHVARQLQAAGVHEAGQLMAAAFPTRLEAPAELEVVLTGPFPNLHQMLGVPRLPAHAVLAGETSVFLRRGAAVPDLSKLEEVLAALDAETAAVRLQRIQRGRAAQREVHTLREQQRLERERLEAERLEKIRLEEERLENERLEKIRLEEVTLGEDSA